MSKVLVISDTHRNIAHVVDIINKIQPHGLKAIIHCGDNREDAQKLQSLYPELAVYGVCGNCDSMAYGEEVSKVITLENVNFFVTHGHRHSIKWGDYEELVSDTLAHEAQVALCGHSHSAYLNKIQGILVMNPGSISMPRDYPYPSYGIIEIGKGQVKESSIMQITYTGQIAIHPATYQNRFQ
ncbi:hypothetical protein CS063_10795 [Sporanaerobium hydrogeniformans]|uniref:Uncharacterized protein n=1 Tax=Sporanaerobium hydrogeniformans TaxID=3072179 RepID=A0AC61DC61_9FIRM|nr:metallophosphoesterase [Sporanaerobium hydrogeniformans]PHV70360.1 hypothetical protein CS063_10795 [Sporanaerobium hydrogeniformans]